MARKINYERSNTFADINNLNYRLFDYLNTLSKIRTGSYVGTGAQQIILVDIIPRLILVSGANSIVPVFWIDTFQLISKDFTGTNLSDGILGVTDKRDSFIIGVNPLVNALSESYYYFAIGE